MSRRGLVHQVLHLRRLRQVQRVQAVDHQTLRGRGVHRGLRGGGVYVAAHHLRPLLRKHQRNAAAYARANAGEAKYDR